MSSRLMKEVSTNNTNFSLLLTTSSPSLVGVQMKQLELNIGSEEIHGVLIGENMVTLESRWDRTILVSKMVALGGYQNLPIE